MSLNLKEPPDGRVVSNAAVPTSLDCLFPVSVESYSCVVGNTTLMACSPGHLSSGQEVLRALLLMNVLVRPEGFTTQIKEGLRGGKEHPHEDI